VATFTSTAQGDLAPPRYGEPAPDLVARWGDVVDRPLSWLRQVHGAEVVTVTSPGEGAGRQADALVTDHPSAAVAVFTADCGPLALLSREGPVAAVHAGWRGLVEGVVEAAVSALRAAGASEIRAVLGPCIHPDRYEFGASELDRVARVLGPAVRGTSRDGAPALDLPAAVAAALERTGVHEMEDVGVCTARSPHHWSHRAAGDVARQALVVWREEP
jgi:YfiH family protein